MDGEPEPGKFDVAYLSRAKAEGKKILSPEQYAYAVEQARQLRLWGDPAETRLLRIEPVESFYELKLKGNVLGNKNIRVFFCVIDAAQTIVVLGVYQKDEEGPTPRHWIISMKHRQKEAEHSLLTSLRKEAAS